jgi:hypothetical protein
VRHTTCATSAWTTPHLATIHHTNDTLPNFAFAVNRKDGTGAHNEIRPSERRFILHFIRAENAITKPL